MVAPDLSDTRLILAWQAIGQELAVTAYRLLDPNKYGEVGKYDFKLDFHDEPAAQVKDFIPIEDDDNLLPSLIMDDAGENLLIGKQNRE